MAELIGAVTLLLSTSRTVRNGRALIERESPDRSVVNNAGAACWTAEGGLIPEARASNHLVVGSATKVVMSFCAASRASSI
jgi:hypothetical protein